MKKFIGILAIALIGLYSCSDDEEEVVEAFKYKADGETVEVSSARNFYYTQTDYGTGYYIYATVDDSTKIYLQVPELEVGSWNYDDDGWDAGINLNNSSVYSTLVGESADYYIEITSYDSDGVLKGNFAGTIGTYSGLSVDYIEITEGEFTIKNSY